MPPSTSLTITNPLHLYRSHLSTSRLLPDPHQHHAALILQSVYHRLLDYTPPTHLDTRLRTLAHTIDHATTPPRRFFRTNQSRDLIRVLTSTESALELTTPQGLLLSGEVGTGKSMLIDLLYHSLPTASKRRWHFNAFMLYIYSELESMRRLSASCVREEEYSLLRLARDVVQKSPVLFLDEFQLPDRAAAKLVSGLLVGFWGLGGVLVGSSNRRPGDLVKGAGTGREGEFDAFLEVLGARCEFWNMGGSKDWRREGRGGRWWRVGFGGVEEELKKEEQDTVKREPIYCFLNKTEDKTVNKRWDNAIKTAISNTTDNSEPKLKPTTHKVYNRTLHVPQSSNGVAILDFHTLCGTPLGPADYITLTSHYHTIFLSSIPQLTHSNLKNESRRFITFLDAIYESGVKLAIRTDAPSIDDLFFFHDNNKELDTPSDPLGAEVYAESYQDLTSPFRPNIALYEDGATNTAEPVQGGVDFSKLEAFTGEDEKFAYRRAVSRLWEVTSEGWWRGVEWRPSVTSRVWEAERGEGGSIRSDGGLAEVVGFSPFRKHSEPPPRFGMEHFWSIVRWGRRAGNWGKGVEGVEERKREKRG